MKDRGITRMRSQFGNRTSTYEETIIKLKEEIHSSAAKLKSSDAWPSVERDYRALVAIEELAGVPTTSLQEILGVSTASESPRKPSNPAKPPELALGEQQESELAAEVEKGS